MSAGQHGAGTDAEPSACPVRAEMLCGSRGMLRLKAIRDGAAPVPAAPSSASVGTADKQELLRVRFRKTGTTRRAVRASPGMSRNRSLDHPAGHPDRQS